ncbi:hypothetical protein [Tenacibaculum sp. 190524A02b]|uniref:hypothetical protein n=1 Tax=Tenacibaculum vairaonense TaxID=3137860 RepID=UPI0031FA6A0E
MKKIILFLITLGSVIKIYSQGVDIVTPQQSPFNSGQNVEGWVQGSVNEPTGKVVFSLPLASINARTVSYKVALGYSGQLAFEAGQKTSRHVPTGIAGVGFSMTVPKIVADHKNTATKEDDTFYLQDGMTNSKLMCTSRTDITGPLHRGNVIWEFEAEKYTPWKIQYYKSMGDIVNGVIVQVPLDYWKVTTDKGLVYYYGQTQNARENMVAWGNWIGDSKKTGGKRATIAWNLSSITDQWNNNLSFEYELQESTIGGVKQTEASYTKRIRSSTGEKIEFTYGNKLSVEFYEPHKEQAEPDAYQERYEEKYLQSVASYDSANSLIYKQVLDYFVSPNTKSDRKRYLQSIAQENKDGEVLPGKRFEYHTQGDFQGGIHKIHYPLGGSVTYTYKNDVLFKNTANRHTRTRPDNTGYTYHSMVVKDNYIIELYKSESKVGDKHRFKVNRSTWTGTQWKEEEYVLPYTIKDNPPNETLFDLQTVFGKDYYGFLFRDGDNVTVNLFHLLPNGRDWASYITFLTVGGQPKLLSGDKFVAVGSYHNGKLHTYTWNGVSSWDSHTIEQGSGEYFYGATNNYILALNEDGGSDMLTGRIHEDNYYIHYLDIENKWKTKTWSASADPYIHGIEKVSYFYPENAMSAFVPHDNPELFLRWDTNYNLLRPDDKLGYYPDEFPIVPTYSGMHVLQSHFYQNPVKYARFNGVDWKIGNLPDGFGRNYAKPSYGEDITLFQGYRGIRYIGYAQYLPNSDSWVVDTDKTKYTSNQSGSFKINGITDKFMILGNRIYTKSNYSRFGHYEDILGYMNTFTYTDALSKAFVELEHVSNGSKIGRLYYINKENDKISYIDLGAKNHLEGYPKLGGRTPFLSTKSMLLKHKNNSFFKYKYRIIEDQIDNDVVNVVVDLVEINNGNGDIRKTKYEYSGASPSSDNTSVFYDTVTIQNIGHGAGNIGKVEKVFNNGAIDVRMAGLLTIERVRGLPGTTSTTKTNTWRLYTKPSGSYVVKLTKQVDEQYFANRIRTTTENTYSPPYYFNTKTKRTNSAGALEETITKYAYEQYPFMSSKNYLSQPYEVTGKLNGKITSVGRTIWNQNSGGKVYASQIWSGTSQANLRKTYEVTRISNYGQVEESNNGKGQYNTVLYGNNYKYPVASFSNVRYNTVVANLDVSIAAMQSLSFSSLKTELSKLYSKLPNAMTEITLYDAQGKVQKRIDNRQEEMNYFYDNFNRLDYTTDHNNKVLKKNVYHYKVD